MAGEPSLRIKSRSRATAEFRHRPGTGFSSSPDVEPVENARYEPQQPRDTEDAVERRLQCLVPGCRPAQLGAHETTSEGDQMQPCFLDALLPLHCPAFVFDEHHEGNDVDAEEQDAERTGKQWLQHDQS